MYIYNEVRSQVETLTPDEQLQLLEELAALVRQRVKTQSEDENGSPKHPGPDLERWFGFLPERVDPLEFQLKLRREEWDREWYE